jgi:hypothetical protein
VRCHQPPRRGSSLSSAGWLSSLAPGAAGAASSAGLLALDRDLGAGLSALGSAFALRLAAGLAGASSAAVGSATGSASASAFFDRPRRGLGVSSGEV